MTGMDDLVTWLRAQYDARERQLDEDERVAREVEATRPGPWAVRSSSIGVREVYSTSRDEERGGDSNVFADAWHGPAADHAARWDPKRVLAEIADQRRDIDAKRRILDEHNDPISDGHTLRPEGETTVCGTCHEFGTRYEFQAWPCTTLRLLALPLAGRDGYREEWAP